MQGTLHHLGRFAPQEQERIAAALEFASQAHASQRRISGEPYITHLIAVAQLLIDEFNADAETVMAGLLHDVVEDQPVTLDEVEQRFGTAIRFMVDGATNVGEGDGAEKIHDWYVRTDKSHEKLRRHITTDPRVGLVKIADRWHNLNDCHAMRPFNQARLAEDALAFTVPLCVTLGYLDQSASIARLCRSILGRTGSQDKRSTPR